MLTDLPKDVESVLSRVRVCELSTLSKEKRPITWPLAHLWKSEEKQLVVSTGVALPRKLEHIHRDDRVSMLFSDFTGSGLPQGTAPVLVQGRASAPDKICTAEGLEDFWAELFRKQPMSLHGVLDAESREMTPKGYWWRIRITVTPERVWTFRTNEMGQQTLERVA
ncbi:pyridoxamine 5'-phosphate oxidase family protein [Streptomyces sp. T-3]|nr:pyridoxamine 5'-phosphate oxidase family protein [Streptomyces sp. T-3]